MRVRGARGHRLKRPDIGLRGQRRTYEDVLTQNLARIDERMAVVDSLFQPLPLPRSAQELALVIQSLCA